MGNGPYETGILCHYFHFFLPFTVKRKELLLVGKCHLKIVGLGNNRSEIGKESLELPILLDL